MKHFRPYTGDSAKSALIDTKAWWRITPGSTRHDRWLDHGQGWYYKTIGTRGIISVGWDGIGDLARFEQDLSELRKKVLTVAKKEEWETEYNGKPTWKTPNAVDYITRTLANFAGWTNAWRPLKNGDGIIAYNQGRVYAIGKISGKYEYKNNFHWGKHTREVRWLRKIDSPVKAGKKITDALGHPPTIISVKSRSVVMHALELSQWSTSATKQLPC